MHGCVVKKLILEWYGLRFFPTVWILSVNIFYCSCRLTNALWMKFSCQKPQEAHHIYLSYQVHIATNQRVTVHTNAKQRTSGRRRLYFGCLISASIKKEDIIMMMIMMAAAAVSMYGCMFMKFILKLDGSGLSPAVPWASDFCHSFRLIIAYVYGIFICTQWHQLCKEECINWLNENTLIEKQLWELGIIGKASNHRKSGSTSSI